VRPDSPFANLPIPQNRDPLSQAMIDEWVTPYYWEQWMSASAGFAAACRKATPEIALTLLGTFDWRPRTVAATIVAVRQWDELQVPLSNLLLRSDVCYAGKAYCYALASLKNDAAVETLCTYLDNYLRQPDLWYDQHQAMSALFSLDRETGTNRAADFKDLWREFVADKPNGYLERTYARFQEAMAVIETIPKSR
jgi:hypothetical protein